MTVTTHLRNQIQSAVAHAISAHTGPLSVTNDITDAVAITIVKHEDCSRCATDDGVPPEGAVGVFVGGRWRLLTDAIPRGAGRHMKTAVVED